MMTAVDVLTESLNVPHIKNINFANLATFAVSTNTPPYGLERYTFTYTFTFAFSLLVFALFFYYHTHVSTILFHLHNLQLFMLLSFKWNLALSISQ